MHLERTRVTDRDHASKTDPCHAQVIINGDTGEVPINGEVGDP